MLKASYTHLTGHIVTFVNGAKARICLVEDVDKTNLIRLTLEMLNTTSMFRAKYDPITNRCVESKKRDFDLVKVQTSAEVEDERILKYQAELKAKAQKELQEEADLAWALAASTAFEKPVILGIFQQIFSSEPRKVQFTLPLRRVFESPRYQKLVKDTIGYNFTQDSHHYYAYMRNREAVATCTVDFLPFLQFLVGSENNGLQNLWKELNVKLV